MSCENRSVYARAASWSWRSLVAMSLGLLTLACSLPAPQASPPPPSPSAAPSLAIADELSPSTAEGQLLPISATADINGTRIDLEVAETDMQRAIGLMFRPQIPD
ncbi:MAG: hypothetical protein AAF289_01495, partial [Cyanobacteria bacterium P01_A01_bin.135]